jgi:AAA+ superfamily predicted ATPase
MRHDTQHTKQNADISLGAVKRWREELLPRWLDLEAIIGPDGDAYRQAIDEYADFLTMMAKALMWSDLWADAEDVLLARADYMPSKPLFFNFADSDRPLTINETLVRIKSAATQQRRLTQRPIGPLTTEGSLVAESSPQASVALSMMSRGLVNVVGMSELRDLLIREVIGPFRNPTLFRQYRVSLPNGLLFFGPPGCGKTYIARMLAEELNYFFQQGRPSDVASPYIHDTVRKIRELFETAVAKAPSILFIDEFDAFVPARSELGAHQQFKAEEVNEFLANLEGCAERNVLVIAATNEPDKIDPAVRRPGRFDKLIFIPPPDADARAAMLEFHLAGRPLAEPLDTAGVAAVLDGYSASDIKFLVDEAARMALARMAPISTEILLAAVGRVPPSITDQDLQRYSSFRTRGM